MAGENNEVAFVNDNLYGARGLHAPATVARCNGACRCVMAVGLEALRFSISEDSGLDGGGYAEKGKAALWRIGKTCSGGSCQPPLH
ncbi:hypothetical protein TSUD_70690 [Trifolium subterraneum]|uniref:Uncharacterized protein n=1 Tax=Trifolium subterraneum TaxID=3900 RepID=A0A2Z6M107_TRISU|nr:hypothetical protein TSUD_70690 [Trifolium subterraneum]